MRMDKKTFRELAGETACEVFETESEETKGTMMIVTVAVTSRLEELLDGINAKAQAEIIALLSDYLDMLSEKIWRKYAGLEGENDKG